MNSAKKTRSPNELRITDEYVRRKVEEVRAIRGEATTTQTATRLLLQIMPFIDANGDVRVEPTRAAS